MLIHRYYDKEVMDDFSIQDERLLDALDELTIINKYLGGNSASAKAIRMFSKGIHKGKIDIIDTGAGLSDTVYANNHYLDKIYSLDKNIGACKYLKKENPDALVICADTNNLPIKNNSVDAVHSSLFLHHFNENELKGIFKEYNRISKFGFVINDLHRSIFALIGIKILTFIFSNSSMVKNDAPLSVKKSFLKKDLKQIFALSGIKNYLIKWKWAFRWIAIIYK